MAPLPKFTLPLSKGPPPQGYEPGEGSISIPSGTVAFYTGINDRDVFLGRKRCVVCGLDEVLEHCHIIPASEHDTWENLKNYGWIPSHAKSNVHEPRNGVLMCRNHHGLFDEFKFFLRFIPSRSKYVLINLSGSQGLKSFHGKIIALDHSHRYSPFPSSFIIHEMRVRGFHPFNEMGLDVDKCSHQGWIKAMKILDSDGAFKHGPSKQPPSSSGTRPPVMPSISGGGGGGPSEGETKPLKLNTDVISEILAATRAMPSWKACQIENTNWDGTAEENIREYISSVGIENM